MAQAVKEIKQRYFNRIYQEALMVKCACGCGVDLKGMDLYGRPKKFINGHNGRKYQDRTQYHREWRKRNKAKMYGWKKARWRMLKVKLVMIFGGKCQGCGEPYDGKNASIFHFHHKNADTKAFALGNQLVNLAWATIMQEAKKCLMLCANCHETRHSAEF